jgi:hypothetical protein
MACKRHNRRLWDASRAEGQWFRYVRERTSERARRVELVFYEEEESGIQLRHDGTWKRCEV